MGRMGDFTGTAKRGGHKVVNAGFYSFDIQGVEEVQAALKAMPMHLTGKVLRNAIAKAAKPYTKQARANMKKISPTIGAAITNRTKLYKNSGTVVNVVGVRSDTKPTVKDATVTMPDGSTKTVQRKHDPRNTAHLVEFGTKPHEVTIPWLGTYKKKYRVQHPGSPEYAPMRRALETTKGQVVRVLKHEVLTGVDKITERLAKRAAKAAAKGAA